MLTGHLFECMSIISERNLYNRRVLSLDTFSKHAASTEGIKETGKYSDLVQSASTIHRRVRVRREVISKEEKEDID